MTDRSGTWPNPDEATPLVDASEGDGTDVDSNPSGNDEESGGSLRRKLAAAHERIAELEGTNETVTTDLGGRLMTQEYTRLGLDPERGIGKAAAVLYEGEPEGLADFVQEEFGYSPTHALAPQIASGHAALDSLESAAGSIAPPTEDEELAAAERRGDVNTSLTMKADRLGQMLR